MATYHYHYDPLDRLIQTAGIQRFYNQSRMTTELEGTQSYSVFQQDGRLLAQRRRDRTKDECHLLGTDLQQSVLHAVGADKHHSMAYNAYGHRPAENGLISLSGFNGERADPVIGHYLLGNGYRAFNPVLMRFNSPDSWSPFGRGGINSYGYCDGDPANRTDANGHVPKFLLKAFGAVFGSHTLKQRVVSKVRIAGELGQPMTTYEKVKRLAPGIYMADLPVSGQKPIAIINAHGGYDAAGAFLKTGEDEINFLKFAYLLKAKKIKMNKYQGVEMYVCNSGTGEALSFASQMSKRYGIPVTGYRGKVYGFNDPYNVFEETMSALKSHHRNMKMIRRLEVPAGTDIFHDINVAKVHLPDIEFNYDPVTYF